MVPSLVVVYAKQALCPKLYTGGTEKVVDTEKGLEKLIVHLSPSRRVDKLTVPVVLAFVQIFWVHIINLPRNMYKNAPLL